MRAILAPTLYLTQKVTIEWKGYSEEITRNASSNSESGSEKGKLIFDKSQTILVACGVLRPLELAKGHIPLQDLIFMLSNLKTVTEFVN